MWLIQGAPVVAPVVLGLLYAYVTYFINACLERSEPLRLVHQCRRSKRVTKGPLLSQLLALAILFYIFGLIIILGFVVNAFYLNSGCINYSLHMQNNEWFGLNLGPRGAKY